MNTSTRPFNLPAELPDPPQPPAGHRGVYRGMGWLTTTEKLFNVTQYDGKWLSSGIPKIANGYGDRHYIEYIPLRPTPEGVAPVPEGFEFYGLGPVVDGGSVTHPDVKSLYMDEWQKACGKGSSSTYALRIGSEIHHRHFDAPEPVAEAEFRYFRDADGTRWKAPKSGYKAQIKHVGCEWYSCAVPLNHLLASHSFESGSRIETDADGNPLAVAGNPVTDQPAKAREWWIKHDKDIQPQNSVDVGIYGHEPTHVGKHREITHVREFRADEAGLLEEAVGWQPIATAPKDGTLVNLMETGFRPYVGRWAKWGKGWTRDCDEADGFRPHFWAALPAPAPEPAFDEADFWAMMPHWITHRAMNQDGRYFLYRSRPHINTANTPYWQDGWDRIEIPPEFAPPPAADWKTSLLQRPTPAQP